MVEVELGGVGVDASTTLGLRRVVAVVERGFTVCGVRCGLDKFNAFCALIASTVPSAFLLAFFSCSRNEASVALRLRLGAGRGLSLREILADAEDSLVGKDGFDGIVGVAGAEGSWLPPVLMELSTEFRN